MVGPLAMGLFVGMQSGASGPSIQISAASVAEDAAIGDLVGTLSVGGGEGAYAFTLTDDAGGLFAIDLVDDTRLEVAGALDYETATTHSVTVTADNGVDDPISRTIVIRVTDVQEGGQLIFSTPVNSGLIAALGC